MSEFVQEQQPEPRVLPPRMTERVQALTELRRDETTTEEPRVPTTFVERLQQFMRQENIGVSALAKRLGISKITVSKWLTGKNVCSTQAEVLHELGLGPPPPNDPIPPRGRGAIPQLASQRVRGSRGRVGGGVWGVQHSTWLGPFYGGLDIYSEHFSAQVMD